MHPSQRAAGSGLEVAQVGGAQSPRRTQESRRITSVALIAGAEQAVFPVGTQPFVYREGMRLRIDVVSGQAFVSEMP